MALHVAVGRIDEGALETLENAASTGEVLGWTVPRVAIAGDQVVFYILRPLGAFVAQGVLETNATPGESYEGHGEYLADIGGIRMLARPVERLVMAEAVPGWGWPRQPHTATTVPPAEAAHVTEALGLA